MVSHFKKGITMPRWDYEKDIDYNKINKENIKDNEFLFTILTIASFIEITSYIYDKNLSLFFKGEEQVVSWLNNTWEIEETQHGKALKKYINCVWPEFDYQEAYERFRKSYLPLCKVEALEDSKAKEMLARMVVETGTSTAYQAIAHYAKDLNEPVLEHLVKLISKDEVYHYEKFEELFKYYKKQEQLSSTDIIKLLYKRAKEINSEDIKIAYEALERKQDYQEYMKEVQKFAKKYYPYKMAIKMFMRPLGLSKFTETIVANSISPIFKVLGI